MEKLSEVVTIKFSMEGVAEMKAFAHAHGMEVSEYIRHLVSEDKKIMQSQWNSLCKVFDGKPIDTRCDFV